jgi:hypothetical protein
LATGSCSLLVTADGLTGGTVAEARDSSSPDTARGESSAPDVASPDAAPSGFCASLSPRPVFCADFDDDGGLPDEFDQVFNAGPGDAALDDTEWSSPPRSLVVSAPSRGSVSVAKTIDVWIYHEALLAFDIKIDAQGYAAFAEIKTSSGLLVHIDTNNILFVNGLHTGGTGSFPVGESAPWTRVLIDVVVASGSTVGSVTVSFGGRNGGPTTVVASLPNDAGAAAPTLSLGTPGGGVDGFTAHFDNVTFETK